MRRKTVPSICCIGGDSTLLEATQPVLSTDKTNYVTGEPIYVTATEGNWVGLYRGDYNVTTDKSILWYYVDGNEGVAVDIKTGVYNADNKYGITPELFVGPYYVALFDDEGSVLSTVNINVTDSNSAVYDENNYVTTNQSVYYEGETIVVTAKSSNETADQAWVGVYNQGATPSGSVPALH